MQGLLTHSTLKCLKTESQANTSSVETDIGEGNHRCLGLVLTDQECNSIPNMQPFAPPNYPLLLVMPLIATVIEVAQMKEQHNE